MKKTFILTLSALLVSASAFAWSKKSEGQANLGRTYIEIGAGAQFNKNKINNVQDTETNGVGGIAFNVPVFKPGVNALEDVSWLGLDTQVFFNLRGGDMNDNFNFLNYRAGIALVPYLNFETGWKFLQSVKPFIYGNAGYEWYNFGGNTPAGFEDQNFFFYGFGGGLEVVLLEGLSVTGQWNWFGNTENGMPNNTSVSAELTYWLNGMIACALFVEHNFGEDYSSSFTHKHGTTGGLKFRIGFNR